MTQLETLGLLLAVSISLWTVLKGLAGVVREVRRRAVDAGITMKRAVHHPGPEGRVSRRRWVWWYLSIVLTGKAHPYLWLPIRARAKRYGE